MKMPFGKYRGQQVENLPDSYLEWLHELDDLRGRLRRAVDSEWHFRRETKSPDQHVPACDLDSADRALLAELVRAGYRALALKYHPDTGGNAETMLRLNRLVVVLRESLAT